MLKVNYKGGFGNTIFQYCFSRIIAENFQHSVIPIISDKIINYDTSNSGKFDWSYIKSDNRFLMFKNSKFFINDSIERKNTLIINDLNCRKYKEYANENNLILDGWFQDFSLYEKNRENIKKWLYIPNNKNFHHNSLTIHIRLGDFFKESTVEYGILNYDFYENFINSHNFNDITIVTSSSQHDFIKKLKSNYNCKVISGKMEDDFNFLVNSKNLLTSHSTLSWFAGFLCDGSVYSPFPDVDQFGTNTNCYRLKTNLKNHQHIKTHKSDYINL